MSITTVDDVTDHLGRPPADTAESALWQVWIDGAEMMIEGRLGPLVNIDQMKLVWVVAEAVASKARATNPEALRRKTVTVDDGTVTKEYFDAGSAVFVTDEWWAWLRPSERRRGAFSISPSYMPDRRVWP